VLNKSQHRKTITQGTLTSPADDAFIVENNGEPAAARQRRPEERGSRGVQDVENPRGGGAARSSWSRVEEEDTGANPTPELSSPRRHAHL